MRPFRGRTARSPGVHADGAQFDRYEGRPSAGCFREWPGNQFLAVPLLPRRRTVRSVPATLPNRLKICCMRATPTIPPRSTLPHRLAEQGNFPSQAAPRAPSAHQEDSSVSKVSQCNRRHRASWFHRYLRVRSRHMITGGPAGAFGSLAEQPSVLPGSGRQQHEVTPGSLAAARPWDVGPQIHRSRRVPSHSGGPAHASSSSTPERLVRHARLPLIRLDREETRNVRPSPA